MGLADKELNDDDLLDLMIQEPTLLRRPIVIGPSGSVVGYKQKELQVLADASGESS